MRFRTIGRPALFAFLGLVVSCAGDPTGSDPRGPVQFSIVSGDGQIGLAGEELALPITVIATDANQRPIPGQIVNFVVTAGNGSMFAAAAQTDANGVAADIWRLGTIAGAAHAVEVRSVDASGVKHIFGVFTATAVGGPPVSLTKVGGDGQTATAGTPVPIPPAVRLIDQYGNVSPNQSVLFTVGTGGGSVVGASAISDAQGVATVGGWTLGPSAGAQTLVATAVALAGSPVTFSATADPVVSQVLTLSTAPSSAAQSGLLLGQQPVVQLSNSLGVPLNQPGVMVTAALNGAGGTLVGTAIATTNLAGQAAFTDLRIAGTIGSYALSFTASSFVAVASDPINLTAGLPAAIRVGAGDAQTANAGDPVPVSPATLVTDASGNAVSGVSVSFAVTAGGGSVTSAMAVSDANGIAALGSWNLGLVSGQQSLSATASGIGIAGNPVAFTANALGNVWVPRASMPTPRRYASSGVINGLVYVAGGKDASAVTRNILEVYDPVANSWAAKASMTAVRVGAMQGVINGVLYVAGGNNASGASLATMESYNPTTNRWTSRASMPVIRSFGASAVINGILYIAGGGNGSTGTGSVLASVYAYDPTTNSWTQKASMPAPRGDLTGVALNAQFYVLGGTLNGTVVDGAVSGYDPATNAWTAKSTMPTPRNHVNAEVLNGEIVIPSGLLAGSGASAVVESYNPVTGAWTTRAPVVTPRSGAGMGVIGSVMYMLGGSATSGIVGTSDAYVP